MSIRNYGGRKKRITPQKTTQKCGILSRCHASSCLKCLFPCHLSPRQPPQTKTSNLSSIVVRTINTEKSISLTVYKGEWLQSRWPKNNTLDLKATTYHIHPISGVRNQHRHEEERFFNRLQRRMALEQVVQKNNTLYLKGHHVPHSFDVVRELESAC